MPQTQTQLSQLLAAAGLRPQKRHGQHFLIDLNLMRVLVDAAGVGPGDAVLEIGCGTGSLTELLAERAGQVIAVDIDPMVLELARGQLASRDNVTFLHADILRGKNRLNAEVIVPLIQLAAGRRLLMVANLPYGAASPVIANALTDGLPFAGLFVTIQREVAERLVAPPGQKDYGPLTVTVQSLASVKILRKVPPTAFWPAPEVDSAMIAVTPDAARRAKIRDYAIFDRIVEGLFTQRRKGLRAAVRAIREPRLAEFDWPAAFAAVGLSESERPDRLSVDQLAALANVVADRLSSSAPPVHPAPPPSAELRATLASDGSP